MWSRSRYTRGAGSLHQRVGIVLRWPIGLVLITFRYIWRVTPVYRRDDPGDPEDQQVSAPKYIPVITFSDTGVKLLCAPV